MSIFAGFRFWGVCKSAFLVYSSGVLANKNTEDLAVIMLTVQNYHP
jgi:hypothetical protein